MTTLVPTFIWSGAPEHYITAIIAVPEQSKIVTGSETGVLCIWDYVGDKALNPSFLLTGQDPSPVIGLVTTTYEWKLVVVAVTADGGVTVSELVDGLCVASGRAGTFTCEPTCIQLLNTQFLAASGRSADIEILDITTRKVIRRLEGTKGSVQDMTRCTLGGYPAVLVSLASKSSVKFWPLGNRLFDKPSLSSSRDEAIEPIQKLTLDFVGTISIDVSPHGDFLLCVTKRNFYLYGLLPTGVKYLIADGAYAVGGCVSGNFLNDAVFVVWSKSGVGYVHVVPQAIRSLKVNKHSNSDANTPPLFKLDPVAKLDASAVHQTGQFIRHSVKVWCEPGNQCRVVSGFHDGYISVWDIPSEWSKDTDIPREEIIPTTCQNGFLVPKLANLLSNFWPKKNSRSTECTASVLLEDSFTLVTGHLNGDVCVQKLPSDPSPIIWKAHSSRVTCILPMSVPIRRKSDIKNYIITGGDDFYVKVWDLETQKLIRRFAYHSGPITALFLASGEKIPTPWKFHFFSASADCSVVLYQTVENMPQFMKSFGPHPEQVVDIRWNLDQDYLVVRCLDNSTSIWEMKTGQLEQCIYGKMGYDIYQNATPLFDATKEIQKNNMFKQAITGITYGSEVMGKGRSPLQGVIFNVRQWYMDLSQNPASSRPVVGPSTPAASPAKRASGGTHDDFRKIEEIYSNPAFKAFSYLLPWGFDQNLDHTVQTQLFLRPPEPKISFGLVGHGARVSIIIPETGELTQNNKRWRTSETMTALHTLASVSLSQTLSMGDNSNACAQLVAHIISEIPARVEAYVNPSLSFLARYWHDPKESIKSSARVIFKAVIQRLSLGERMELASHWSLFMTKQASDVNNKSKDLAVLVLGILACEKPDSLTKEITKSTLSEILEILMKGESPQLRVAAVELLGKGYPKWQNHIEDISAVLQKLFKLSIIQEPGLKTLQTDAHHALMLIGSYEPRLFLCAIGSRTRPGTGGQAEPEMNPIEHSLALGTISSLVKKHPDQLLSSLPLLVESVVRSLDPHVPYLRNACLKAATNLVHELVRKYPMVAFHQVTQRLAVGDRKGPLLIYDLISATRWFTLESHKNSISAVAFSDDGKVVASYSVAESTVKLWKQSPSFFGILGSNTSCYRSIVVSPLRKQLTEAALRESVRLQWLATKFILFRTWDEDMKPVNIEI